VSLIATEKNVYRKKTFTDEIQKRTNSGTTQNTDGCRNSDAGFD